MLLSGDLLIRADASREIGAGHVMRCLGLAQAWQLTGRRVHFISVRPTDDVQTWVRSAGFGLTALDSPHPHSSDLEMTIAEISSRDRPVVIVDGYHFDEPYQKAIKDAGCRFGVIDDLAQLRQYHADVIINQNPQAPTLRYRTGPDTTCLLGLRYVMLRPEFRGFADWTRSIPEKAQKILVTFGGSDPRGASLRVMEALAALEDERMQARVIAGALNPRLNDLRVIANRIGGVEVLTDVRNIADHMQWADVAVCAGGGTAWELACMGVPMIVVSIADNQVPGSEALEKAGLGIYLGPVETVTDMCLRDAVRDLAADAGKRGKMSELGRASVDGLGATRVAQVLMGDDVSLRRAVENDCRLLWEWTNEPGVRAQSFSSDPIPWEEHAAWFASKLNDPQCLLFIGDDLTGQPIGQIRFDISEQRAAISISLSAASRGRGLGPILIRRGGELLTSLTDVRLIDAYVKPDNAASVRAFEKAGYVLDGTSEVRGQRALHFTWTKA